MLALKVNVFSTTADTKHEKGNLHFQSPWKFSLPTFSIKKTINVDIFPDILPSEIYTLWTIRNEKKKQVLEQAISEGRSEIVMGHNNNSVVIVTCNK